MTPIQRRKNSGVEKSVELKEIAELVRGELSGDPHTRITGVAGIKEAKKGDVTFLANAKYASALEDTKASAIIVSPEVTCSNPQKILIRTANPSQAFNKVIALFTPELSRRKPSIHASAVLDKSVELGKDVFIGPCVVIEAGTVIGDNSIIEANTFIGENCQIGEFTRIYPNVTLLHSTVIGNRVIIHSGTVIGSDGFGYENVDGALLKIPQTGCVVIDDDVEIGANVCIDRARFDKTWIKKGSKIDNLVQIAHNVVIGENNLLVSQCGISGSSKLGNNVIIAGQAGIVGHVELGDNVIVGAGSGVTKSVPENTVVLGAPAKPIQEQKKIYVLIGRLPELFKELSDLKKKTGLKEE